MIRPVTLPVHRLHGDNAWRFALEQLPAVHAISAQNAGPLETFLATTQQHDPYLASVTYFLFTGRNGLWFYDDFDHAFIFCLHPNEVDEILIFSPQITDGTLCAIAHLLPPTHRTLKLCRMPADNRLTHAGLIPVTETSLDWRYPSHIIATADLTKRAGGAYMVLRNRLRQLKDKQVEATPIDFSQDRFVFRRLIETWAEQCSDSPEEYEDLIGAYRSIATLTSAPNLKLHGVKITVDGSVQAVAVYDVVSTLGGTANLFVNLCNHAIKGLSEYLITATAAQLHATGIPYLNLGGSETERLDFYKRKFNPAISLELSSYVIPKKRTDDVQEKSA